MLQALSSQSSQLARSTSTSTAEEWLYVGADGCDGDRCNALLAQLDAMPRTAWLEIGRRELAIGGDDGAARALAVATLEQALSERRLAVTAWLVRDAVDTAAYVACQGTPAEQRLLVAARRAAELAALAHLARPWLRRDAYRAIIAPFFFVPSVRGADA